MTRQLPLDLGHDPRYGDEDFLESPSNAAALAMIRLWPGWPNRMLLLTGPEGAGKTHLGAIWARRAHAGRLVAADLTPESLPTIAAQPAVWLEDADSSGLDEKLLFHLLNMLAERSAFLLVTARRPADHWGLATADLLSRLRRAPHVAIEAPDDSLMRSVLVKLFFDRQVLVDENVIDFLALRLDRSLGAAQKIVAALDREGLARGRAITRPMAGALLQVIAQSGGLAECDFQAFANEEIRSDE